MLCVSATPGDFELERVGGVVVEQLIRPTGLVDPEVDVRPVRGQVDDLLNEIRKCEIRGERVLVTTLTKRMAEDLTDYLMQTGVSLWWKQTFYDESAKIPLIMAWPGFLPAGQQRTQVVNLTDLAATILEACAAPALPDSDGRSFLEVARDSSRLWLNETYSEYCTDGMAPWTGPVPVQQRMIRSGKWKLIYYHGHQPQLFDLEADPREINDLADDPGYRDIRDGLTARILADWNPETISADMAARRQSKELLKSWSRSVLPPDCHRWKLLEEDNWLDEEAQP